MSKSFFRSAISSTLFAIFLIICVTVLILTIIILVKGKLKIKHDLEQANELLLKVNSAGVPQCTDEIIDTFDNDVYGLHNCN